MTEELKTPEKEEEKEKQWTSADWFLNPEVLYLKPEECREVTLNPGYEVEWFRKTYLNKGELVLTKKEYRSDLPRNLKGKIIAVTAAPIIRKDDFNRMVERQPYISLQKFLKPKPLGKYYELFKADTSEYQEWVGPHEYIEDRRKNKKVHRTSDENKSGSRKPQERAFLVVKIK